MKFYTQKKLYMEIHDILEHSIQNLVNPQEPDYIAALVKGLPTPLSLALNNALPHIIFKVAGCFIHQKPLAKFCNPPYVNVTKPEIGDLLIVYKEMSTNRIAYNALLLQAKKVTDIYNYRVSNSDLHQLTLYTKWPKFKYVRAGNLNDKERSIQPKSITPGAQYLLIGNGQTPCGTSSFWCAMPNNVLIANNSLALQLIKLIEFQTGRPFGNNMGPGRLEHWSQMIWDLMEISVQSSFNRRRAGYSGVCRHAGDVISLLCDITDNSEYSVIPNEEGISILCIEGVLKE